MYKGCASWQRQRAQTWFGWTGDMRQIIAVAMLSALPALADDYSSQMQYAHTSSSGTALSRSVSAGVGIASGGNAAGGAGVGNGGTASLTYNEAPAAAQSGSVTVRNTPDASASNIAPTAPCMGGVSVGGSGPGFGVVFGGAWKDGDCSLRETARSFAGLGLTQDAIAILCASEYSAAAPSCVAMKAKNAE